MAGGTRPASGGPHECKVAPSFSLSSWEVRPRSSRNRRRLLDFATCVRRAVIVGGDAAGRVDVTLYLSSSADVVVTAKQTVRNLADLDEPVNGLLGIAQSATEGVVTAKEIERPGTG